ncbi:MAG TPA: hypothetical protein VD931_09570 [Baekduia sp.]|nr:hypothetical protein [Baekduia sp.]
MASVNASTYASLDSLLVAEVLDGQYVLLLAERNALPNHPALMRASRPIDHAGSNVIKIPHIGLMGYDLPSALADGSTVGNTALTDGSTTISVVRYSKAYAWTDLAKMVQPDGKVSPTALAMDAVVSAASRETDLICDVIDGFTATGGPGTGVDLDVASVMAIIGAAKVANFATGVMGVLHGQQWSDLIVDAGTSLGSSPGGSQQYNPELAALQSLRGDSYVGSWLGVDWFVNNRVKTANGAADRAGAIFARGGVMIGEGTFAGAVEDPANQVIVGGKILFERSRDAHSGETSYPMHQYVGVSKGIEAGITIISDA